MLLFSLMNVLFEAATIEGRARALGKRHQKQHLYDDAVQAKSNDPNHQFQRNTRFRGWLGLMKSRVKNLLALAVCAGAVSARPAKASIVVADWTFPATGAPTAPISATSSTDTTGTPTIDGTLFPINHGFETYTTSGGNDVLQITYAGNHSGNLNGQTLTLTLTASTTLNLTGLTYLTSFSGATGANAFTETWSYSINGGASTSLSTVTLNNGNLDNESLNPGTTLTAGQSITFTAVMNGATGNNGALDFGNFSIAAVPEPVTWALIGFGVVLGVAGVVTRGARLKIGN